MQIILRDFLLGKQARKGAYCWFLETSITLTKKEWKDLPDKYMCLWDCVCSKWFKDMRGNVPWKILVWHHIKNVIHVNTNSLPSSYNVCNMVGVDKAFKILGSCVLKSIW
jgi:hypothetical protein